MASKPPASQQLLKAYARLPLTFIANAGQLDPKVRYYAQGSGYGVYLTPQEIVLALLQAPTRGKAVRTVQHAAVELPVEEPGRGVVLALRFVGANPAARLEAQKRAPGQVNYLRGNDPAHWHTGLATYGEVLYRDLWPAIDMVLRGEAGVFKYEFVVQPGARVEDIRLTYRGAQGLSVERSGDLLIDTPLGVLRDSRPASYQLIEEGRVRVESRYVLRGMAQGHGYGFAVASGYDPRYPLVIDPGLVYSTFLGGGGAGTQDEAFDIALDAAGNAYVTGFTNSPSFTTTPGAFDRTLGGDTDGFVTKLNATGSALVYSTFLGGTPPPGVSGGEGGSGIAVDALGNVYVVGLTISPDFPTTPGAFDRRLNRTDVFVTKLNAAGSALVYSSFLGGGKDESGPGIALDAAGNAYVGGFTNSPSFPTTPGAFDRTLGGGSDGFVTKLNAGGSALVYSTFFGGGSSERFPGDIAVDAAGNAYVTGITESPDFPTTPGAFDRTLGGNGDGFVTKLNVAGSALAYSTLLGGNSLDEAEDVAVDGQGNAYVTGTARSPDFPTTVGAFDTSLDGESDAFVTKLNAAGLALVYSTFLGGTDFDFGFSIAVDPTAEASVTGATNSRDFPTTSGAFDRDFSGSQDVIVTELNAAGSALIYSSFLGGVTEGIVEHGTSIAVDGLGNAYVTGFTPASDFPTTAGAFDRTFNGGQLDAFVTKLVLDPTALCVGTPPTLVGTPENDLLVGTPGPDVIAGLGGNDRIEGRAGDDVLCGGPGFDVMFGGDGRDRLFGQSGNDGLAGGAGADALHGGAGLDLLEGGDDHDFLDGAEDNDELDGGAGNDLLLGGLSNDMLRGAAGDDTLFGNAGADRLNGGSGTDSCSAGAQGTGESVANCESVGAAP